MQCNVALIFLKFGSARVFFNSAKILNNNKQIIQFITLHVSLSVVEERQKNIYNFILLYYYHIFLVLF